jgi:hypothetical protein
MVVLLLLLLLLLLVLSFTVIHLGSANSHTLAVAASKLDIYQMPCVQFELLMMGGKPA